MTIGFAINSDNCFGCKACQQACEDEHLQNIGVYNRRVRRVELGAGEGYASVSMSCNHCDDPACQKVCPTGAYSKMEDGTVIQDHSRCIGCKSCIFACPFHAPVYDETEHATYKCDTCIKRRTAGLAPRCVVTCPGDNIQFGDVSEIAAYYDGAASTKDVCPTKPNLFVKPAPNMDLSVFKDIDGNHAVTVDRGGVDF